MPKKKDEARDVAKELAEVKTVEDLVAVLQVITAAERRENDAAIAAAKARVRKG